MNKYVLDENGNCIGNSKPIIYVITENNCWECISHSKNKGYPQIYRRNSKEKGYRYVYELYKGKIPEGLHIMHLCDNPACINPNHLKPGTHQDNMDDMNNKGRGNKGRKHSDETKRKIGNAHKGKKWTKEQREKTIKKIRKLSDEQILEIEKLIENKIDDITISNLFNVSARTIQRVRLGYYK